MGLACASKSYQNIGRRAWCNHFTLEVTTVKIQSTHFSYNDCIEWQRSLQVICCSVSACQRQYHLRSSQSLLRTPIAMYVYVCRHGLSCDLQLSSMSVFVITTSYNEILRMKKEFVFSENEVQVHLLAHSAWVYIRMYVHMCMRPHSDHVAYDNCTFPLGSI